MCSGDRLSHYVGIDGTVYDPNFSHFEASFFCFFPQYFRTRERRLAWFHAKSYHPTESSESYQEKCHFVFPFAGKASERIREEPYLELLEEDIETVEIPIEIMRNRVISTVGTMIFFSHGGVLDGELFEEFNPVLMKESDIADTISDHRKTRETESEGKP